MGSDSRSGANCKLGGACGTAEGERADVEMVVHIAADRSNATVMSIPRDLVTELPSCAGGGTGMINSALTHSEGCQVDAVEKLTSIPIDHFVKITFTGVVSMSDAVGGVNVCVTDNVYDPDSHLKLKKGTHTLKGQAALEFVRTRHGFGDGSDIGRTVAQHIYLSAAIKAMKSAGTLTNPAKVYDLANAATKALKVDDGLGSIPKLIGLADDLNKVPTSRITFTTMQYVYGTGALKGRVLIGPNATKLFQSIANDTPLTKGKAGASAGASASASSGAAPVAATSQASVSTASIAVRVENGTGVTGRAGAIVEQLVAKGFSKDSSALTGSTADTTTLTYPAGKTAQAHAIATALGLPSSALKASAAATHYTLLIGADWKAGAVFPSSSASAAAVSTKEALADSNAQTSDKSVCAPVGHQLTVVVNHRAMTPVEAYSASTGIPDSAP
ncbi:LCP family protein [Streptacidiphilus monticola]